MNEKTKILSDQARQLPPKERVEMVEQILSSLDMPETTIDQAWSQEASERLRAYRACEVSARPFSEILAKYTGLKTS